MTLKSLHLHPVLHVADGFDSSRVQFGLGGEEYTSILQSQTPPSMFVLMSNLCSLMTASASLGSPGFTWNLEDDGRFSITGPELWEPLFANSDTLIGSRNMLWEWIGFSAGREWSPATKQIASHKPRAMFSHELCNVSPECLEASVETSLAASGEKLAAGYGSRCFVRLSMEWIPASEYERFRLWLTMASSNDSAIEGYMPIRFFEGLEEKGRYTLKSGSYSPNVIWNDSGTYFSLTLELQVMP